MRIAALGVLLFITGCAHVQTPRTYQVCRPYPEVGLMVCVGVGGDELEDTIERMAPKHVRKKKTIS